jgi:hypothetical protein
MIEANLSTALQSTMPVEEFNTKLSALAEKWKTNHQHGLELRYETGTLLNAHFGPSGNRQANGAAVLKNVAKELQAAESDLSRMRSFAHHFSSIADFRTQHPDVNTWTAVKKLLTIVKAKSKAKQPSKVANLAAASKHASDQAKKQIAGQIDKLRTEVENSSPALSKDAKKELREQFAQMSRQVKLCLQAKESSDDLADGNTKIEDKIVNSCLNANASSDDLAEGKITIEDFEWATSLESAKAA